MTEIEARLLEYLKSIDNRDKKAVLQSIALFLGYARKKAQQNRQRRQAQENAPETTNTTETPAPIVVIPTPVNNVPAGETLEETQRRRRRELGIKGYDD